MIKAYKDTHKAESIIRDYSAMFNVPVVYTITYPVERGKLDTLSLVVDLTKHPELAEMLKDVK